MTAQACFPAAGRRLFKIAATAAATLIMTGCANWPASGNNGAFYTDVTRPVAVLDQEATVVRKGEACAIGVLGLYAAGNSSIAAAKAKAGIDKISTVEEHFTHVAFGAYSKYCTVVTGT